SPVSLLARRSGIDGAGGATVSTVMVRLDDGPLVFPAASAARATSTFCPSDSDDRVRLQSPPAGAGGDVPFAAPFEVILTRLPASADPPIPGVASLVRLSTGLIPGSFRRCKPVGTAEIGRAHV